MASMGPRPIGRGISDATSNYWTFDGSLQWGRVRSDAESQRQRHRRHLIHLASMGPRPIGRGILLPSSVPAGAEAASMGPRPIGRGIIIETGGSGPALTQLQWGRVRSDAESRRASCRLRRGSRCFNGAASDRTRNQQEPHHETQAAEVASMGPRPIGRGILSSCQPCDSLS